MVLTAGTAGAAELGVVCRTSRAHVSTASRRSELAEMRHL